MLLIWTLWKSDSWPFDYPLENSLNWCNARKYAGACALRSSGASEVWFLQLQVSCRERKLSRLPTYQLFVLMVLVVSFKMHATICVRKLESLKTSRENAFEWRFRSLVFTIAVIHDLAWSVVMTLHCYNLEIILWPQQTKFFPVQV